MHHKPPVFLKLEVHRKMRAVRILHDVGLISYLQFIQFYSCTEPTRMRRAAQFPQSRGHLQDTYGICRIQLLHSSRHALYLYTNIMYFMYQGTTLCILQILVDF